MLQVVQLNGATSILALIFVVFLLIIFAFYLLIFTLAIAFPLIYLFLSIRSYGRNRETSHRLFIYYIEMAIVFSVFYYILNSATSFESISNLKLPESPDIYTSENKKGTFLLFIHYFFECLHYSIVVQTTLGFGDMVPKTTLAKIITDAQVLLGIYFIVIAIGKKLSKESESD